MIVIERVGEVVASSFVGLARPLGCPHTLTLVISEGALGPLKFHAMTLKRYIAPVVKV